MFESFDEDKSGTLEKDEILSFITKMIYEDKKWIKAKWFNMEALYRSELL